MAETFVTVAGTFVIAALFVPHARTVPVLRTARLKEPPAPTAGSLDRPAGMFVWPAVLSRQTTACAPANTGSAFINNSAASKVRIRFIEADEFLVFGWGNVRAIQTAALKVAPVTARN